jgi:hypothetical protein
VLALYPELVLARDITGICSALDFGTLAMAVLDMIAATGRYPCREKTSNN